MTSGIEICFTCPKFKSCMNPKNAQKPYNYINCRKEKQLEEENPNDSQKV